MPASVAGTAIVAGSHATIVLFALCSFFALRDDLTVREIPAPQGLAPNALAIAGDVRSSPDDVDSPYGTGRLVLLHDPEEPAPWNGPWRIVCFAQAPLEPEIGTDPFLAEVTWSWLTDALEECGAASHALGGTVTRTASTRFGELAGPEHSVDVEIRASWTAEDTHLDRHLTAWLDVLGSAAGLPPPGVRLLGPSGSPDEGTP